MDNKILNELERYKEELVAHCNKILDMIAELRRDGDVNDNETSRYLNELLLRASMTQSDIVQTNRRIEALKPKDRV